MKNQLAAGRRQGPFARERFLSPPRMVVPPIPRYRVGASGRHPLGKAPNLI